MYSPQSLLARQIPPLFLRRSLTDRLPPRMRDRADRWLEIVDLLLEIRDPRVLRAMAPAGLNGLVLRAGDRGAPTSVRATHPVRFDWAYSRDQPELARLYERGKLAQWNGATDLAWSTSVDPLDPEKPLIPRDFLDLAPLAKLGIRLDVAEKRRFDASLAAWMLSQFLHGEQGALFAAAQITESVPGFDAKLYGASQVVDEARHVEVFHRYMHTKLGKLYTINDNLHVVIESLTSDARWDMKFLGMQIMVEGLALGAFGTLYKNTREPLLKSLLRMVILDEARHVHYGIVGLRAHLAQLSDRERHEREEWACEVAMLMRNRFLAYEVFEEWFEGRVPRATWRQLVTDSAGMKDFRRTMFKRLVPNLRALGLIGPRVRSRYAEAGLMVFYEGGASSELGGAELVAELDAA